jgi:amidase
MDDRKFDVDGRGFPYKGLALWTGVASVAGLPVTTMPIGLGVSGLPVGVQIIGPCLEDRTTMMFAELADREFGGFVPPPAFAKAAA